MGRAWPRSKRRPGVPRSSEAAHLKINLCKVDDERQNKLSNQIAARLPPPPPLLFSDLPFVSFSVNCSPTTSHKEFWENFPYFSPRPVSLLSTSTSSFLREREKIECSLHSFAVLLCLSVAPPLPGSLKHFQNCPRPPFFFSLPPPCDCQTITTTLQYIRNVSTLQSQIREHRGGIHV